MRARVWELIGHEWLDKFVKKEEVGNEVKASVVKNLLTFRKASYLQSNVMSFIGGLVTELEDLKTLTAAFLEMDVNNDGVLSKDELMKVMKQQMSAD
jgi:Ca2+-binding EF-hand superfamily protein